MDSQHLEVIKDTHEILAIIIRRNFTLEGIQFFTPDNFSQQLAFMHHRKGKKIRAHLHNAVKREVFFTQEVLFLKRGKLKVDLYRSDQTFHSTLVLETGDTILLAGGGHAFEVLEDIEMIEVKQGPYTGEADKKYFEDRI